MMNWEILLNKNRLCESKISDTLIQSGRSEFQRDYDRIVFSSAFRRLQDKTQIFPMPESDFVHTRLTHSLEVSCVGRSLGNLVGKILIDRNPKLKNKFLSYDFGEVVASACLAHDIGNPPFGHSGEDAISEFFRNGAGNKLKSKDITEREWNDLTKFEGNAQGFRIITKLQNPVVKGGLQLTYATLAAFTKYPHESPINHKVKKEKKIFRKYGFFQAEKELFEEVASNTGLLKIGDNRWCRHPLAFLVEAADDICYRIMDWEDGFRLGLVSFQETEEKLKSIIKNSSFTNYERRDINNKIGYLRAKALGELINQISEVFVDKEDSYLNGKCDTSLINEIPAGAALEEIRDISVKKIYAYKSVTEREIAGYEVLGGLLEIFINAVNDLFTGHKSHKYERIIQILPKQFIGKTGLPDENLYKRLLKITDFVSGMTDTYAVSLFRKIKGIALPSI